MSFTLCACTVEIDLSNMGAQWGPAETTEPERVYDAPEENDAIKAYLEAKYGGTFTHKSYDAEQEVLYYKSDKYSKLFKVYTKNGLWLDGYDITGFTEEYADNGYYAVTYNDAYQYYWNLFSYIPDMSMVLDYDGDVLPSDVSPNVPFEVMKKAHPEYFNPIVYLLFEEDLSVERTESIRLFMEAQEETLTVCIVTAAKDSWSTATIERIEQYPNIYNVRQYFSTVPENSGE
jgi:hypothetical protein